MGDEPFLFIQDGDPAHIANLTQQWLSDRGILFIPWEEWLGKSSDLNPIENFWDILQQHVTPPVTHNISDLQITTWSQRWCRDVTVAQCRADQVSMLGRMSELDYSKDWSIAH